MKSIAILFTILFSQLSAATTNLEAANKLILFGSPSVFYTEDEGKSYDRSAFSYEHIISSDLKETANGKVNAIIDYRVGGETIRYQENNLFYSYVEDIDNEAASFALTKSGLMASSDFSSIDFVRDGTELLKLDDVTGAFSPTGIYVLNLLEVNCLTACDDPYPELTALNQVPLPGAVLFYLSSLFGLGIYRQGRDHQTSVA